MNCLLPLLLVGFPWAVVAFQPRATTSPPLTDVPISEHFHDFWRKPRSETELEKHIHCCLDFVRLKTHATESSSSSSSSKDHPPTVEVLSAEPPLVVIHDFLAPDLCDVIIDAARETGNLQRSSTGAEQDTSAWRTSSTVWLKDQECPDPLREIAEKVSVISGLPTHYQENLQVVRYQPGQDFQLHTDHQDSFNDLECRGRLATCLLYLAEPSSGGETWFPGVAGDNDDDDDDDCQLKVQANRGSAVFFWNTIEKPGMRDYSADMFLNADLRLRHAGLPVGDHSVSEKWICNRWIHPTDFGAGVRGI